MDVGHEDSPAEWAVDAAAASLFAASVAFAALKLALAAAPEVAAAAAAAFLLVLAILRNVPPAVPTYVLPVFDRGQVELAPNGGEDDAGELQLTMEQAVPPPGAGDELQLHDRPEPVEPDERVVRLFGRRQAAAAGCPVTIDRSVHPKHPNSALPDAARLLSDALAELRRSLR